MSGPPETTSAARQARLALGSMALSAVLFATMNCLARVATASTSWATVAAVRATVGALVAYAAARARGRTVATKSYRAVLWRSFFGTISMVSTFYALSSHTLSLGDTSTLLNLSPVFLAVLAPIFLRERTSPVVALAIGVALTGVMFVVRPSFLFGAGAALASGAPGPSAALTAAVATGAALSTAIAMMMLRRVGQTESPEAIAFHFSVLAAVTMTIVSLFDFRWPNAKGAVCMIAAGICAGFAQLAMTRAYSLESAAKVSGLSYLAVVASTLLGIGFLGEKPGPTALLGMFLVVCGGVLVTTRKRSMS